MLVNPVAQVAAVRAKGVAAAAAHAPRSASAIQFAAPAAHEEPVSPAVEADQKEDGAAAGYDADYVQGNQSLWGAQVTVTSWAMKHYSSEAPASVNNGTNGDQWCTCNGHTKASAKQWPMKNGLRRKCMQVCHHQPMWSVDFKRDRVDGSAHPQMVCFRPLLPFLTTGGRKLQVQHPTATTKHTNRIVLTKLGTKFEVGSMMDVCVCVWVVVVAVGCNAVCFRTLPFRTRTDLEACEWNNIRTKHRTDVGRGCSSNTHHRKPKQGTINRVGKLVVSQTGWMDP